MTHVVTQNCCNDASCVLVCPVNCIHPTPDEPDYGRAEMLYIDPSECIDCGACLEVCPVGAISPDFELTDESAPFELLNTAYYLDPNHQGYSTDQLRSRRFTIEESPSNDEPLRVAIIGSGPSACYAAEQLLAARGVSAEVTMIERLPVPFGLVRFGVAPDHQATKDVTAAFNRTLARKSCEVVLNVTVGEPTEGAHVSVEELMQHHHAVIHAAGASLDRALGIPGEDLGGSSSATEFVGWYNGSPDYADHRFNLTTERVVVVGNGNVALDVARVLVTDPEVLAATDMADYAIDALRASTVQEVVVCGRRGPAQAAFTTPELIGLTQVPGVDVIVDPADLELPEELRTSLTPLELAKIDLLEDLANAPASPNNKRVVLRFHTAPVALMGDEAVTGIRVAQTTVSQGSDGQWSATMTENTSDISTSLVLRSVGYRGRPLPGLPFDDATGRIPNRQGRIVEQVDGEVVAGAYAIGWIKRGPTGVIGTNKRDAEETVAALLTDYAAGRLSTPTSSVDELMGLITTRQPLLLRYPEWKAIDKHEREAGKAQHRPRVKLTTVSDMLAVAAQQ